jgi:hypothetical protein
MLLCLVDFFSFYYLKDETKGKVLAEQSYANSASLDHLLNNEKDVLGLNCDAHTSRGIFICQTIAFFTPWILLLNPL